MKQKTPSPKNCAWRSLRRPLAVLLLASLGITAALADTVYVTGCVSNCVSSTACGSGPNVDVNPNTGFFVYNDNGMGALTSAKASGSGVSDKPVTPGSRYFSNSFSNSTPDSPIIINPALGTPGAVYRLDHTYSSTAGNCSSNVIVGLTNISGCTLSTNSTDKFQSKYGNSPNSWSTICYVTNGPGSSNPQIGLYFVDGTVSAGPGQRMEIDTFKFVLYQPCLTVTPPSVNGPLSTNTPYVTVTAVSTNATKVTVYQDSGSGMTSIGSTNVSSPAATVVVRVAGLVAGAKVGATQTVGGQESCTPTSGALVGIGPNSSLRVALSIRGNPNLAGPVWTAGGGATNLNIYFLGASALLPGTAPDDGLVVYPSNNWQTVKLQRGPDPLNPINPTVLWNNGTGTATPDLEGDYGALDGIALTCNGDPGYYDLYIDDIANGTNGVVENYEGLAQGTTSGFSQPSFSGTTAGSLMSAPNVGAISGNAATSGSNSTRVEWQFISNATNQWLRLVHSGNSGVANPQVNLNEPISFKLLLLRPGDPLPQILTPLPVQITGIKGTSLSYSSGGGSKFVLLKSANATAAVSAWTRMATNSVTPSSFTIPAVGTGAPVFYSIKSE